MSLDKNNPDFMKLVNENFCLQFELQALAKHILFHDHERWVPGFMNSYGEHLHLNRYKFARNYITSKVVLDIASGSGYGSYYLATEGNPERIDAVDISEESVRYANCRYPHNKVNRIVENAENFIREDYYDVVVSFETIEHLSLYGKFIENIYKSLKSDGLLLISTPVVNISSVSNLNPYHKIEWSMLDFQNLINKKFIIKAIYVQNIKVKRQEINNLYKKALSKVLPFMYYWEFNPELIKYENQYNPKNIVSGFQILVCEKKA